MIIPSTSSLVTSLTDAVPTIRPFFITVDPVGEVEDVVDVVADEEDADALGLELLDQLADLGGLGRPERGGRLVHDQDARVEMDRARDRDRLALAARERLSPDP